ncbi:MFS transporter [Trueperella bialowiezensis]|uniref:High-copy suppressor of rspA n=1 Tax=Trueperella bialowiezensis TaxID=312285 RepID=A0A448PCM6_9ACTO|nr:MFS transporter [Trueperella bialowiezensis]VEI12676.1 High-copy suppressor of rspA [Trueperella bialowiezensis]
MTTPKQPNQVGDNPRYFSVAGSDRVYDRNKLLAVLLVPLMMTLMQISSVNNTLSAMGQAVEASDAQLQWVLSGYALAVGIVLVPAGRIGDIFGRSSVFAIGLGIFTVASLLVGLSDDATLLNIMRLVQGFGAGVLSPQTTGLIQQYFTGHARARAFSLFGLVVAMSVAVGPLMSGVMIGSLGRELGWRWAFIINFPLGILGLVLAFMWLPFGKERRHVGPNKDRARAEHIEKQKARGVPYTKRVRVDLDPVGMLILVLAVLCIMLPFMSTGLAWVWALLPVGVLLTVAWVAWERWYKNRGREPMVDLDLFRIKTFSFSAAISAAQFLGTTSIFAVLALFLQRGLDTTALQVGLVSLPNALISGYAAMWAGKRAVEHGREIQVFALGLMFLGVLSSIGVVWGIRAGASFWWLIIPLSVLGFGQGAMGSANQTQSMLDVPPASGGTAGGVTQTGQRIATAIGNAVITAVFFLGQRMIAGLDGSYLGIALAYTVVLVFITLALIIAIAFLRHGRTKRKAS